MGAFIDCLACLKCLAQPAADKPRKTYNILVPDIFAESLPTVEQSVSPHTVKKIGKLGEYVHFNPARSTKVSRRLYRRATGALAKGKDYGPVKVAVYAYIYLLAKSSGSSYTMTFRFFTSELLQHKEPLVPLLLKHANLGMHILGAELLGQLIRVQTEVDNTFQEVQSLMPIICGDAQTALDQLNRPSGNSDQDPPFYELLLSCLRATEAFLILCNLVKTLPAQLYDLQAIILNTLSSASATRSPSSRRVLDNAFYHETHVESSVGGVDRGAMEVAEAALQQVSRFTQDIASVHPVLDAFFTYLDKTRAWSSNVSEVLLKLVGASGEDYQFPVFSSLVRHTPSASMSAEDCASWIEAVGVHGGHLPLGYSLSALILVLQELPSTWVAQVEKHGDRQLLHGFDEALSDSPGLARLRNALLQTVTSLSWRISDPQDLAEGVNLLKRGMTQENLTNIVSLEFLAGCVDGWRKQQCTGLIEASSPSPPVPASGPGLPLSVVQALAPVMAGWQMAARLSAHRLLLDLTEVLGGLGKEEEVVEQLLKGIWKELCQIDAVPGSYAGLSRVWCLCVSEQQPRMVLMMMRMILVGREECVQWKSDRLSGLTGQQVCSVLAVLDSLLLVMARRLNCPGLSQWTCAGPTSALGLVLTNGAGLQCESKEFPPGSEAQAQVFLEEFCSSTSTASSRNRGLIAEAMKIPVLQAEYAAAVVDLLSLHPFVAASEEAEVEGVLSKLFDKLDRSIALQSLTLKRDILRVMNVIEEDLDPLADHLEQEEEEATGGSKVNPEQLTIDDILTMTGSLGGSTIQEVPIGPLASKLEPIQHS